MSRNIHGNFLQHKADFESHFERALTTLIQLCVDKELIITSELGESEDNVAIGLINLENPAVLFLRAFDNLSNVINFFLLSNNFGHLNFQLLI